MVLPLVKEQDQFGWMKYLVPLAQQVYRVVVAMDSTTVIVLMQKMQECPVKDLVIHLFNFMTSELTHLKVSNK